MTRPAGNARFWDRAARKYAAGAIADMDGYERTLERARAHLGSGDAVFEFGCGTGTTALKLAPVVGLVAATDISGEMIAIARGKAEAEGCANVEFAVAAADAGDWPDGAFDAVLAFNLLHLLPERAAAISAARRLLKPGGLFISKTPCLKEMSLVIRMAVPVMRLAGKAPYVSHFDAETLENGIAAAGFEIIERGRHASKGKDPRLFLVARRL
jgi:ubiquinone/menaquinone biosynthesis C-methylase UbiE